MSENSLDKRLILVWSCSTEGMNRVNGVVSYMIYITSTSITESILHFGGTGGKYY